jgi:YVTN family beta-propeller protein
MIRALKSGWPRVGEIARGEHSSAAGAWRGGIGAIAAFAFVACGDDSTAPPPPANPNPTIAVHVVVAGGPIDVAALSNGTAFVTLDAANTVQAVNLATGVVAGSPIAVGQVPTFVIFDAAGTTAYVSNQYSDNVGVINVSQGTQVSTIPVHGDPIPMQVAADGSALFVTTNLNRLYKISLASKTATDSLALPATSHHLLLSPNGTRLYVATRDGGSVLEVDPSHLTLLRTFTLGGRTQAMVFSPDRNTLYVANETKPVLQSINLVSGAMADSAVLAGGANGVALSADGTLLYASIIFGGELQVVKRTTMAVVSTVITGGVPRAVIFDAPRNQVVVANETGWVDILR